MRNNLQVVFINLSRDLVKKLTCTQALLKDRTETLRKKVSSDSPLNFLTLNKLK